MYASLGEYLPINKYNETVFEFLLYSSNVAASPGYTVVTADGSVFTKSSGNSS